MFDRIYPNPWLRKRVRRLKRRTRLLMAFISVVLMAGFLFFYLPSVAPRYLFTLGGSFTVLTPKGFELGQLYDFNSIARDKSSQETRASIKDLDLPRPDNRVIHFKYPETVTLGRPTYLGSDISQSVDFCVKNPPASGLIQIWVLNNSMEEFLNNSKEYSNIEYLTFETKQEKSGDLNYTIWNYTYKKDGAIIRGMEAFFDDPPYMYRISIFCDNKDYNEKFRNLFNEMAKSVTVK